MKADQILNVIKSSFWKGVNYIKKMDKNTIFVTIAIVGILVTGVLIFTKSNDGFTFPSLFGKSKEEIGKAAIDYINSNQLSQSPASLVSVSESSGLVKIKIKIGTSEFDSYATKDGKLLFPQAFEMTPKKNDAAVNSATGDSNTGKTPATVTKSDKPMLEAYVVSRCPYGLQMQRAMADAVKNMPSLAQYIKAMYIGSVSASGNTITAMHGEAEAAENLRQICIREEQPAKYWNYTACQMKAGDTAGCEASTGVDAARLNACISDPSKGVAYAKKDFDLSAKYNVTGSPTLILNGAQVSESSFGGRSSDGVKSMVCAGFNTQASFCTTKLNTAEAAVSFSAAYASSGSAANANSGSAGTNCAPAQ